MKKNKLSFQRADISHVRSLSFLLVTLLMLSCSAPKNDQVTANYVSIGFLSAVVYEPPQTVQKSDIGIVVMHSHGDYMGFIANSQLAQRGFTVIATAPNSSDFIESKVLSVKNLVGYLRSRKDINKVVLLGHSGGATVMTAYALLAEQGRAALEGKIYQDYSDKILELPKIDGLLLLDANPGLSTVMLNSIDPNVTDETRGLGTVEKFTEDDQQTFMRAQRDRYMKLVRQAQARLEVIKAGKGNFEDDEPLVIPGASGMRMFNRLYTSDVNLLSHTKGEWPLIHADGSVTTEQVHSVRAPFNGHAGTSRLSVAENVTVRSFLSTYAINVDEDYAVLEDGFQGIQFDSNLTSPIGNIKGVTVPSLFMGMTGSYEYLSSEAIYNNSPAADKTLAFVEGASHMFGPDPQAEKYNNADYGDTVKNLFDYVAQWLNGKDRF